MLKATAPSLPHAKRVTPSCPAATRIDLRQVVSSSLLLAVIPFLSMKSATAQIKVGAPQQISVGVGAASPDNNSNEVVLPPNGDFVVFSSDATNLLPVGQDTNAARDLFLRTKGSSAATLLSVAPEGTQMGPNSPQEQERSQFDPANFKPNLYPAVSPALPDGTYGVTFVSSAINMRPAGYSDVNEQAFNQVYLRIPKLGKTVLISGNPSTKEIGNGPSFGSSITAVSRTKKDQPDSFLVVFTSCATNLVSASRSQFNGPGGKRLYLAKVDLTAGEPTVSVALLGGEQLLQGTLESLSQVAIPNVTPLVYNPQIVFDNAALSGDGSTVAFTVESPSGISLGEIPLLPPFPSQVFRLLVNKGDSPEAISFGEELGTGVPGDGPSLFPSISRDGKLVAFSTKATNLGVTASENQPAFLLWRDSDNTLTAINKTAQGAQGNGTEIPTGMISPDGRFAVWSDKADNLVAEGDTNGFLDIFLKDLTDKAIIRVSKTESNEQLSGNSFHPVIGAPSFSSTKPQIPIAFASDAPNLGVQPTGDLSRIFASSASFREETIKNNAPISLPPDVAVNPKKKSVTLKFIKFRFPSTSKGKWTTSSTAEMEAFMAAATKGTITYEIFSNIKTRKRYDSIQQRNRVTLEQVKPGTYYVQYRAIAQLGKKKFVTKKSPRTTFTVKQIRFIDRSDAVILRGTWTA